MEFAAGPGFSQSLSRHRAAAVVSGRRWQVGREEVDTARVESSFPRHSVMEGEDRREVGTKVQGEK